MLVALGGLALSSPDSARAQPVPQKPVAPGRLLAQKLLADRDGNKDGKLNADECPEPLRPAFGRFDVDRNGYLDEGELEHGLGGLSGGTDRPRGPVVAKSLATAADDFVVEVYHNGQKVPDTRRAIVEEVYGATSEKVDVEVRTGDWLVFHVVNNRLRWDGSLYFAAAGLRADGSVAFASNTTDGLWSSCDDPAEVPAFIAGPAYQSTRPVHTIERKFDRGDAQMEAMAPGWGGTAVWGEARSTWIKCQVGPGRPRVDPSPTK